VSIPLVGAGGGVGGPVGYTYAALVVRVGVVGARTPEDFFAGPDGARSRAADASPAGPLDGGRDRVPTRGAVLGALRESRFSGWVGDDEDGWLVVVPEAGAGAVASGRRGVVDLAAHLAAHLGAVVVALRVVSDRQLLVVAFDGADEVGRYVSDPSVGRPAEDDTLPDPVGVEHAEAFAAVCGVPDAADDLAELLAEELDPESVIESERLAGVLRLLGLPGWVVAASSLPRDVPAGPRADALTRLGAGTDGIAGRLRGRAVEVVRRRRTPPDPVPEGRQGPSDADLWLLG
jgi:hypothetical protein